jgi:NDP-sugar pyrophosphorylase family protein
LQGIVLAAGKGSRLHPITVKRSKAMLPILGQPIVERVMEGLWNNGVREFVLVVSPEDKDIIRYFTDESPLRGAIEFVEQAERQGMAHALSLAAPFIGGPFVLSACDNLVAAEHIGQLVTAYMADPQTNATLSLMRIEPELIGRTGIVELHGNWVTRIVEKPKPDEAPSNIASLPLYVFTPRILDYLPEVKRSSRGEYELQDAIQMLIERDGWVRGVFTDSRLTLTGPEDLLAINRHYLLNGNLRPHLAPYTVGPNTQLITPLRVEPGTTIGADCVIGPRVYIERDATIGVGVTLRDAVVLRGAVVPAGSQVVGQVVS